MNKEKKTSPGEEYRKAAPEIEKSRAFPGAGSPAAEFPQKTHEYSECATRPPKADSRLTPAPEQTPSGEERENEPVRSWIRRVLLDASLLGMGMLLVALVLGALFAGGLVLLAGGAMEVMVFAGAAGILMGISAAMVVQVIFMRGMARPVRLCSLLLLVWGLTLIPLCWVCVNSVLSPQYDGTLNRFVFTRAETALYIVCSVMTTEFLAWIALVVRVVSRCTRAEHC